MRGAIASKGVEIAFGGLSARVRGDGFFLQRVAILQILFRRERRSQLALCGVKLLDEIESLPREEHFVNVVGVVGVEIARDDGSGSSDFDRRWRPRARERSVGIGSRARLELAQPRSRERRCTGFGTRGDGGCTRRGEIRRAFRR